MPRTVYYSKKYTAQYNARLIAERAAKQAEELKAAAPQAKTMKRSDFARLAPPILVVCLLLAIGCVLLIPLLTGAASPASSLAQSRAQQQVAYTSYDTPQAALGAMGIKASLPAALPEGFSIGACRVLEGDVLELELVGGKTTVIFRTAKGSGDLSGDNYNDYAYTTTETVDSIARGYAGVSDKKLSLAVWARGDYSYAVVAPGGIETAEMKAIAESVV